MFYVTTYIHTQATMTRCQHHERALFKERLIALLALHNTGSYLIQLKKPDNGDGVMSPTPSRGACVHAQKPIDSLTMRKIGYLGLGCYEQANRLFFEGICPRYYPRQRFPACYFPICVKPRSQAISIRSLNISAPEQQLISLSAPSTLKERSRTNCVYLHKCCGT